MKKLVVLSLFSLFATTAAMAQTELSYGIKGGLNFSSFSGNGFEAYDDNGRTSFHIGALVEIPVTERFAIQPEVLYSGQGYDILQRDGADDLEYQIDYINVPVMAKFYVLEGLYAEAGPQIGFLANSQIDGDPDDTNSGEVNLNDDQFNDIDFSLGVGLGYKFNFGLFANARYNFGLTDVYDANIDAKNAVFAVSVGYMF